MKTNRQMLDLLKESRWDEVIGCLERLEWKPNEPVLDAEYNLSFGLLECFVQSTNAELTKKLLDLGASVNARRRGDDTALMIAVSRGNEELVDLLLNAGAKLELKRQGVTSLMRAAQGNHESILKRLLAAGASVVTKGSNGMTALSHALLIKRSHERIVKLLLDAGSPVDGRDLHSPVALREADAVKALLSKGCDVNARFDWNTAGSNIQKGDTPLLVAVADTGLETWKKVGAAFGRAKPNERLAIVDMLLAAGADVNVQRRQNGLTPLLLAASQDEPEIAKRLMAAGADPERQFDCKLVRFPFSKPKTRYPKAVSAMAMARMRPRNKLIRRLLLGAE